MFDYQLAKDEINSGWLCKGNECSGWILSDFDTWERCGCGKQSPHPEEEWYNQLIEIDMQQDDRLGSWCIGEMPIHPDLRIRKEELPF